MEGAVRLSLAALAVLAMAVGATIVVMGPDATARGLSALLGGRSAYRGGLDHVNAGSELRFYAVAWIAWGGVLIRMLRDLDRYRGAILVMLALLFAGGMARLLGLLFDGPPDLLFQLLMWGALFGPVILGALLMRVPQRA
ncbi:MAG: protein of unknown function containing DUF4345 domain [Rhodobacteraceae bacterium HLUCCA08]|nr:MAG: protein of unknown function containing DUF4345 domain [Rhodobacteraceae bacterium HLUCCA08]